MAVWSRYAAGPDRIFISRFFIVDNVDLGGSEFTRWSKVELCFTLSLYSCHVAFGENLAQEHIDRSSKKTSRVREAGGGRACRRCRSQVREENARRIARSVLRWERGGSYVHQQESIGARLKQASRCLRKRGTCPFTSDENSACRPVRSNTIFTVATTMQQCGAT